MNASPLVQDLYAGIRESQALHEAAAICGLQLPPESLELEQSALRALKSLLGGELEEVKRMTESGLHSTVRCYRDLLRLREYRASARPLGLERCDLNAIGDTIAVVQQAFLHCLSSDLKSFSSGLKEAGRDVAGMIKGQINVLEEVYGLAGPELKNLRGAGSKLITEHLTKHAGKMADALYQANEDKPGAPKPDKKARSLREGVSWCAKRLYAYFSR